MECNAGESRTGGGRSARPWEEVGKRARPSWYLDRLAALQKRETHANLVRRWAAGLAVERVLKTDLFEEAFGEDQFLPGLFPEARLGVWNRRGDRDGGRGRAAACGTRGPGDRDGRETLRAKRGALDLVISTSTLDHFERRGEFVQALGELSSALRPGGLLILTLDNPWNPLYHPLRLLSRIGLAPFPLGYTPFLRTLRADLRSAGFDVEAEEWLIHNPRLVSTVLFLALRKLLGRHADAGVAALLRAFHLLRKLPTRRWTACFQAVSARKMPE